MGVEGLNRDTKVGWSKGKAWDNLTEVKTSPAGSFLRDLGFGRWDAADRGAVE